MIKHQGVWKDRLKPDQNNPREVVFAEEWAKENTRDGSGILRWLLETDPFRKHTITQEEATAAATVTQWLGSNVGFSYLVESLKKCGYQIVRTEPEAAE